MVNKKLFLLFLWLIVNKRRVFPRCCQFTFSTLYVDTSSEQLDCLPIQSSTTQMVPACWVGI